MSLYLITMWIFVRKCYHFNGPLNSNSNLNSISQIECSSAAPLTISGAPPSYADSQASHGGVTSSVANALHNKSSTAPKSSMGAASQPSLAPSSAGGGGGGGGRMAGIRSSMGKGRLQRKY